jgi:hypothetical protein
MAKCLPLGLLMGEEVGSCEEGVFALYVEV